MIDYAISIKYMITGYTAILVILVIYLVSLFLRWRKLKRDLETFKNLKDK